ncbi:hypothetical protein Tsubulata_023860 [Turnera subulata]|uniref:Peptidase S8/S53 domain-containing protein n=1 Tax=Turnera subulata TaxID=218843 RepID=A0A9Q0F833_9ROSI|nr:hypothetical protein Tsubulata_023860 [Turnera subulata]
MAEETPSSSRGSTILLNLVAFPMLHIESASASAVEFMEVAINAFSSGNSWSKVTSLTKEWRGGFRVRMTGEETSSCADILAAFDDAITDGVDIISVSLGSVFPLQYMEDLIAIGSYHAMRHGTVTSCSAANSGPYPYTVANHAPLIMTVADSTTHRKFMSQPVLGNGLIIPTFVDPRQQFTNPVDYVQAPFPKSHVGSVPIQHHFHVNNAGVTPCQFIPMQTVTALPSPSHVSMRPPVLQPSVQSHPHYDENAFGTRIVQLPVDPSYTVYHAQPPPTVGGGHTWHQCLELSPPLLCAQVEDVLNTTNGSDTGIGYAELIMRRRRMWLNWDLPWCNHGGVLGLLVVVPMLVLVVPWRFCGYQSPRSQMTTAGVDGGIQAVGDGLEFAGGVVVVLDLQVEVVVGSNLKERRLRKI